MLTAVALVILCACHNDNEPEVEYELSIDIEGQGKVVANPFGGSYAPGTTVTLTAYAAPGWYLREWVFDVEKENKQKENTSMKASADAGATCKVVLSTDIHMLAVFQKEENVIEPELRYELTIDIEGQGKVIANPSGGTYSPGTTVTLTAYPDPGWYLHQWVFDAEKDNANVNVSAAADLTRKVIMTADKRVLAVFQEEEDDIEPELQYELSIETEGQGKVISNPRGDSYSQGTTVTLTAYPDPGWYLHHWFLDTEAAAIEEDTDSVSEFDFSGLTCEVVMREDIQVLAVFKKEGTGNPQIVFDEIPPWGGRTYLKGHVWHVAPADYRVAVIIKTSNHFNKPTWKDKTVPINPDGTWSANITTGTGDEKATEIFAALVKADYEPPTLNNAPEIPQEVFDNAYAICQVLRDPEGVTWVIHFSGYEWHIRKSEQPEGPPSDDDGYPHPGNYFSDNIRSVWVDAQGRLHMIIRKEQGLWKCAEIVCASSLGYGTYSFTVKTNPKDLDFNAVAGFFLWSNAPEYNHREIDIEFARWGLPYGFNVQYAVQPWYVDNHRLQFDCDTHGLPFTHSFNWTPESVLFTSEYKGYIQQFWEFSDQDIPVPGDEQPRINLWLCDGYTTPPSDGQVVELVVESFHFSKM
jgi:hypothetical protein